MWNYLTTGLRVMVVDDDSLSLKVVGQLLKSCGFSATCCTSSTFALDTLRKKRSEFDLVLSDVFMPDVDGFKLLQMIGLELNLPVIMMSTSATTDVVFRGVTHGAVDFLIKPVRVEELRNIWQHVVRRKKDMVKDEGRENAKQGNVDGEKDRGDRGSAGAKKRKDAGEGKGKVEDGVPKKPRVTWSVEMHEQFVNAVAKLGIDKAVPKKILEIMNVSGLTRENVASHLQKYRLYLKRMDGMPQQKIHRSKHTPSETSAAARISSVPASVVPSPSAAVPATAPSLVSPNMSMVNLASHMPVMVPPIDPTNIQLQMPMGMNLASMLQPGLNPLVGLGLGMGALAPSMLPLLQHQQQVVQQLQQFGQLDARSLHVGADTSQPLLTGMTNAQPDSQYTALHQRHAALPVVSPPTPTEATSQPSPSVGGAGAMMTKDAPKASPSMRLPQAGAMGVNGQASLLAAGCISGDGVMVPVGCLGGTPANADPSVPMFQVPSQPGGEVAQVKSEGSGPDQANEEDRALLSGRVRDLAGVSGPPIFPEAGMVGFTGGHGEIGLGAVDNSFDLLQTICDRSSGLDGMDVDDAKESMMELFDEFLKGSTTNITTTTALR